MSCKGDGSSASSVDLSRRDFRAMMYYDYCQGKSFQECFQSLKHCFGAQFPPKATIFRWFRQFMSGARTLEDNDRCCRTATTVTPENVSGVESLIKKDPKMVYAEIQDIMKISSGSLARFILDCLGVRKRWAHWVPHNLSEEQKQGRVAWCTHMLRTFDRGRSPRVWDIVTGDETWVYRYDPETVCGVGLPRWEPTREIQRKQKCLQAMIARFFAKCGHVASIPLEDKDSYGWLVCQPLHAWSLPGMVYTALCQGNRS